MEARLQRTDALIPKLDERRHVPYLMVPFNRYLCSDFLSDHHPDIDLKHPLCLLCRLSLEAEKRALADKVTKLASQLAEATKATDLARRADGAARKEAERLARSELQVLSQRVELADRRAAAAESRAAELLEQLEGAETALRESLATASKLHKVSSGVRCKYRYRLPPSLRCVLTSIRFLFLLCPH